MNIRKILLLLVLSYFFVINKSNAQRGFGSNSTASCGTDVLMNEYLQKNTAAANFNKQIELQLKQFRKLNQRPSSPLATVVLPVVVHIVHNNGPENISDARVLAGIQHLNEAFKNSGYYDPATGVNTNIQFCLVKRDPAGMATTGITRDFSAYTNMNGPAYYSDDQNVKNVNRWNPLCYINIWLVNSTPGSVAGYAYLPSAHGSNVDGILMEAGFLGASNADDVVVIHEMGHFLGLYHTFEQGCTNNDCTTDGDKVCDTPPDNSTAYTSCGVTVNSCSTDALSGFTKDMDDLTTDYMDYGNWDCMSVFTQGQSDRMNWFTQNVRSSLLNCNSCQVPCPSLVQANFTSSATTGIPGTSILFTNNSVNGAAYKWYINDSLVSNAVDYSAVFTQTGVYVVRLIAISSNPVLCLEASTTDTIVISCPVKSSFTPGYNGVADIGQNISFTNTSTGAITYEWYKDNVLVSTTQDYSTSFGTAGIHYIKLKAFSGSCVDSVSVYYVVNDGASVGMSYRKNYELITGGTDNFNSKFNLILPDQNILNIGGKYNGIFQTATVAKLTPDGEVIWAKAFKLRNPYPGREKADLNKAIFTKDGGILFLGHFDYGNGLLLIKTDNNGNLLWNKLITAGSYDITDTDIKELPDGSFIASARFGSTPTLSLYKFSANGSLIWDKVLTSEILVDLHSLLTVGNDVYFSGSITSTNHRDGQFIMKIDPSDGKIIFGKKYSRQDGSLTTVIFKNLGNRLICRGLLFPILPYGFVYPILLITDLNGNNSRLKLFTPSDPSDTYTSGYESDLLVDGKNNILFSITEYPSKKSHLLMLDTNLSVINGKTYSFSDNVLSGGGISQFSNGDYLIGNSSYLNTSANIVSRLRPDLSLGECPVENFTTGIRDDTCTVTDITDQLIYIEGYSSTSKSLELLVEDRQILVTPECRLVIDSPCNTLMCKEYRLEAPLQICNLQDTVVINLKKSAGCNLATKWTVSGVVNYQSIEQNDSLMKLAINSLLPGRLFIKARSMSSCKVFEDSITIDFYSSPDKIDLGQDIQLCNASTIQLHAGNGFKTYQWQDGSVDSTFTAYLPGTYYVTATNFCGSLVSDTIYISIAPDVPFDLGPDKILCLNDTLQLTAPPGFTDYKWSPDYKINTAYGAAVRISPLKDTVYTVTATKAFGCTVLDNIRVTVIPVDAIRLGKDTAFCAGGFVSLNAGNSFLSYLWSTGASTPSISITSAGIYHVMATDNNGCRSRDTLQVTELYKLPVVSLGADKNICTGDSIVLNAGNGFQNYTWQDNSINARFTVRNTGKYWVSVKDINGCTGADTILIMNVVPRPVINLGADTSFCSGEQLLLTPGAGFTSYTWQDNSTASTFNATQPGIYSVTVKDGNNCVTADSLRVISLYPKPVVNIGNDTALCRGQSLVLNAGNGFLKYLWNTNAATQLLTVNNEGNYWVKVNGDAGCFNTDSIRIATIDTPKLFLAAQYNICDNRPQYIKPLADFSSYLWYNGSTSDSILIVQPGNYWLSVTNSQGCAAKENFNVAVTNCINAIYFPNAFSPNDDGRNESFKPLVSGQVNEYRLSVFNRFGEKVFESTDYAKGWNGWFKQKRQNPGTYVWYCVYTLGNGFLKTQTGTVVLVR